MRGVIPRAYCIAALLACAVGLATTSACADEAAETGMGIVYGETEMAKSVCSGLVLDEAVRADLMAKMGVDPLKPTAAFKAGVTEADERAAEAVANERLRSFCLEMRGAYGMNGTSVPGLLRDK